MCSEINVSRNKLIFPPCSMNYFLSYMYIHRIAYMWTFRREDKFSSFFRSSPDLQSNILPNSPDFYMFTWLLHVHVPNVQFAPCFFPNVQFAPCSFRPTKQDVQLEPHTCGLLNPLHSAEVVDSHFKANMNSYIQLQTAAILFLSSLYLKQGIDSVYVMVGFICKD